MFQNIPKYAENSPSGAGHQNLPQGAIKLPLLMISINAIALNLGVGE